MENIRPIKTDDDLAWAIAEVSVYFENQPHPGSSEGERFDVLSDLIETYENKYHPIDEPEPIEVLIAHMAMTGRTQVDLSGLLGSRSRASEVLGRRRALNIDMIRRLSQSWNIPAGSLIAPYHLADN
jgi:HTH-type transcriptional regulator / antitoxin HigA